jgi:hypothetical protein
MQPLDLPRVNVGVLVRRSVSEISNRRRGLACPRCKGGMREVVRIPPLQSEPGLIAYECSACTYTTSEILPAQGSGREV